MTKKELHQRVLVAALVIIAVLLFTAYAKICYPMPFVEKLQVAAGVFEVVFAFFLWFFYRRYQIWMVAMFIFGAWGGYTFFWMLSKLPCGCLGVFYTPPSGLTFGVDMLFYVISAVIAYRLGANKKVFKWGLILSLILAVGGYFFGQSLLTTLQVQLQSQHPMAFLLPQ